MINQIEFIENNEIVTYKLDFDKNKIKNFEKKLKRLGLEKEITIKYNEYSTTTKEKALETGVCDEVLEIIKEDTESTFDPIYIKSKRGIQTTSKIRVKNYPIIYHLLFGKYKQTNPNFLRAMYIYLSDSYGLKDQHNDDLYIFDYDIHINQQQKEELILELLDTITYEQIAKESLEEINHQLDIISQINAKSKEALIKEIKTRISQAQENTQNLEKIHQLIRCQEKKSPKRRVKNPC